MSEPTESTSQPPPPVGPPLTAPPPPPDGLTPEGQPGGPQPPAGWGPGRTFAGLLALIGIVMIGALIVAAFDSDLDSLAARLSVQTVVAGSMIAVALLAAAPTAGTTGLLSSLGLRRPRPGFVWITIGAYLVYIACALLIAAALDPEQEDIARELGADEGTLATIAAGVLIIVGASLSEELFFRGFMFAGLRRAVPFVVAAVVSASIWGLFHYTGPGTWGVVLQLSILGVILCWLYERTNSIWPPIALHALNNTIAFSYLVSS